jgi:hypothetical protein
MMHNIHTKQNNRYGTVLLLEKKSSKIMNLSDINNH